MQELKFSVPGLSREDINLYKSGDYLVIEGNSLLGDRTISYYDKFYIGNKKIDRAEYHEGLLTVTIKGFDEEVRIPIQEGPKPQLLVEDEAPF